MAKTSKAWRATHIGPLLESHLPPVCCELVLSYDTSRSLVLRDWNARDDTTMSLSIDDEQPVWTKTRIATERYARVKNVDDVLRDVSSSLYSVDCFVGAASVVRTSHNRVFFLMCGNGWWFVFLPT
jgi:hypothetical protein